MNLKNQNLFDNLDETLSSTLEFLRGKESRLKEMENEMAELEDEINLDISKGHNVSKKKLKLKDLERSFREYEVNPSDILIECTHINNINNCIAKINGNRVKTYGEAKLEYEQDLISKEKLVDILKDMENKLSKIKNENDVKSELRKKIVNTEMHINSLDSRIKLYQDNFKSFSEKEQSLKSEKEKYDNEFNSSLSEIEKKNKNLNTLIEKIKALNFDIKSKQNSIEEDNIKLAELNKKTTSLSLAVNNDANILKTTILEDQDILKDLKSSLDIAIKEKRVLEKNINQNNKSLLNRKNKEPMVDSTINFINSQYDSLEVFDDVNDLWKFKFNGFKENIEKLAKENKYTYSNANGDSETPLNPLIEYTDRLKNMITFIQENDIVIDEHDEVEPEIIYRDKPKESKINPIVVGAIALSGAYILSKTKLN